MPLLFIQKETDGPPHTSCRPCKKWWCSLSTSALPSLPHQSVLTQLAGRFYCRTEGCAKCRFATTSSQNSSSLTVATSCLLAAFLALLARSWCLGTRVEVTEVPPPPPLTEPALLRLLLNVCVKLPAVCRVSGELVLGLALAASTGDTTRPALSVEVAVPLPPKALRSFRRGGNDPRELELRAPAVAGRKVPREVYFRVALRWRLA